MTIWRWPGSPPPAHSTWDTSTWRVVHHLHGGEGVGPIVAFSPGKYFVSGFENTIKVWGTATAEGMKTLHDSAWTLTLAFSLHGRQLVSGTMTVGLRFGTRRIGHCCIPSRVMWGQLERSRLVETVSTSPQGVTTSK